MITDKGDGLNANCLSPLPLQSPASGIRPLEVLPRSSFLLTTAMYTRRLGGCSLFEPKANIKSRSLAVLPNGWLANRQCEQAIVDAWRSTVINHAFVNINSTAVHV